MKRLISNILLLFFFAFILIGMAYALTGLRTTEETAARPGSPVNAYPPPPANPPTQAYPGPQNPTEPPSTPLPKQTRPPEPSLPPISTLTPSPPTATPQPLPTLDPNLDTLVYATTGEVGPEIYRVQFERAREQVQLSMRVDTPYLWQGRTYLQGLHASPNNQYIAVEWQYGEGGSFISILKVNDGTSKSLFSEATQFDQRVTFLDWSPKGDNILVLGQRNNPDLQNRMWLVDIYTSTFKEIPGQPLAKAEEITSASFSPDGRSIVYARNRCYQCGSEIRWVTPDNSQEERILFANEGFRIQSVLWSPDGNYLAFTRWKEGESGDFQIGELRTNVAIGELWLLDISDGNTRQLGSVLTGYHNVFGLDWSPGSSEIAFIQPDSRQTGITEKPTGNLQIIHVLTGRITPVTNYQNRTLMKPTWFTDRSIITVIRSQLNSVEQFDVWLEGNRVLKDNQDTIAIDARAVNPSLIWFPTGEEND